MVSMENEQIVVIGTGAEARIALDAFSEAGILVLGVVSDPKEKAELSLNDVSVFSDLNSKDAKKVLTSAHVHPFVTAGDIPRRKEIADMVAKITDRPPVNCIHPRAWISQYAKLGIGNLVNAGVVINANCFIGNMNLVHSNVSIEPDAVLGDYCTLNSGVRIGSSAELGHAVFVGTGAIIHPGIKVGDGALIGAGAVVLKEVKAGAVVFGNPAQEAAKK